MKPNETLWNTPPINGVNGHNGHNGYCDHHSGKHGLHEELGDAHVATSTETPLRPDAFEMDDETKMEKIAGHFREIMHILGLDLEDDSLKGTPGRVAKMYVKEIFSGLNPANKPDARMFENKYQYNQMLVEKDITFLFKL